jgi:putative toxin-antitoxin system antitoxin component (TIGR02293 family)
MNMRALLGTEVPENQPLAVLDMIEAGLPTQSLNVFKSATGLTDVDLATVLNLSGRTFTRLRSKQTLRLPADLTDRLVSIATIYQQADEVFGDHATALAWLNEPQFALAQRRPRDLLSSDFGRRQTRALLRRIEHGQLA